MILKVFSDLDDSMNLKGQLVSGKPFQKCYHLNTRYIQQFAILFVKLPHMASFLLSDVIELCILCASTCVNLRRAYQTGPHIPSCSTEIGLTSQMAQLCIGQRFWLIMAFWSLLTLIKYRACSDIGEACWIGYSVLPPSSGRGYCLYRNPCFNHKHPSSHP